MALQLKLDTAGFEAAATRARGALDNVKAAAVQVESATDRLGKSDFFGPLNQDAMRARQSIDQMRQSMDPAYASAVQYKNAVLDIDQALRMQAISQQEAAEMMQLLDARYSTASLGRLSKTMEAVGSASAGSTMAMKNFAFQLNQIAQQGAVTGNYLGALAVQIPDIFAGFGSLGAVLTGGAIAVGLAALPALFGNTMSAAEDAADAIELYAEAFDQIKTDLVEAKRLEEEYTEALKTGSAQRIEAIEREAEIRAKMLQIDLLDLKDQQDAASKALADAQGPLNDALAEEARLREELAIARATKGAELAAAVLAEDLATATAELERQQRAYDKQFLQQKLIQAQIDSNNEKLTATTAILDGIADGLGESTSAAVRLEVAGSAAASAFQGLAGWAAMANANIAAAASNAAALRANAAAGIAGSQPDLAGPAGMGAPPPSGGAVLTSPRPGRRDVDFDFGGAGGGGGGGGSAVDDTRAAYDRLLASLDPVVAKAQDLAEAQQTVNDAFAAGEISAEEQANALDLIAAKYGQTADAMSALKETGGNAIDALIGGTKSLGEALKDMARELVAATIKAQLLKSVTGGTSNMSIGGLIMQGLFSGFHDGGGKIGVGQFGVVGERGPEIVTATPSGAMVTSRADTARMMQQAVKVDVAVTVDDEGKLQAYVRRVGRAGMAEAVDTVKRNLAGWNAMLSTDGALV